jgi:hypothetical protein
MSITSNNFIVSLKAFWLLCFLVFGLNQTMYSQEVEGNKDSIAPLSRKDARDLIRELYGSDPFTNEQQAKRDSTKVYFSVFPSFTSAGSEKGFVTSFMSAFYFGNKKTTNLSTIYFTPYFTFSDQWVIPMRTYIWTNNNKLNLTGDYRFLKYPQEQYDIYESQNKLKQSRVFYYQTRFYQTVSRSVAPNLALGLGFQYDYYASIKEDQIFVEGQTAYQKYGDTAVSEYHSIGPTLELIYDNRRNTINPLKGNYLHVSYRANLNSQDQFEKWSSLIVDYRKYFSINLKKERVLAAWFLYWSILNNKPHYLDLPSNGWDNYGRSGRGLYRNRYRSTGLLYNEYEYRTPISKTGLWGMVAFVNFTSPAELFTQNFTHVYAAGGLGLRLKFDKRTGGKIGADIAFSGSYWTYYLTLNEYF